MSAPPVLVDDRVVDRHAVGALGDGVAGGFGEGHGRAGGDRQGRWRERRARQRDGLAGGPAAVAAIVSRRSSRWCCRTRRGGGRGSPAGRAGSPFGERGMVWSSTVIVIGIDEWMMHLAHAEPVPWLRSSPPFEVRLSSLRRRLRGLGRAFDAPRSEPHSAEAHLRPAKSSMPQTTIYVSPRSLGAPDERPPAVVTTDLARLFAGSPALAGVSLRIRAGGCVALLGPNGAGKTTLLRLLATAIRPSYGSAAVDGLDVGRDAELVRERVAYLSHAIGLYDDLTARENLEFAATMLATPDRGRARRARARRRRARRPCRRPCRVLLGRHAPPAGARPDPARTGLARAARRADGRPRRGWFALVEQLLEAWREAGVSVLMASHSTDRLERCVDAQRRPRPRPGGRGERGAA